MKKNPVWMGIKVFGGLLIIFLFCISLLSYFSGQEGSIWGEEKIAIVEINGTLLDPRPIIENLNKFRKNKRVKAIVLRIDSPGGGVGPAQEIYAEVKKVRREKKVLVSMGSTAASGGYYVACSADKILANPGSITGSIGVVVESLNVEKLFQKIGLSSMVVKSGRYKDIGSPTREMTAEEKKLLQGVIDNVHEQFIQVVAKERRLPLNKVRSLADGRIFSGEQAKELGLIDDLGSLEDTISLAAKTAGIKGEPEVIYPIQRRISFLDLLLQGTLQKVLERSNVNSSYPFPLFLYFFKQAEIY